MILAKVYADRFRTLYTYLKDVPDDLVDLSTWRRECGTIACAIGHAGSIPEFIAAGFTLVSDVPQTEHEVEGLWVTPNFVEPVAGHHFMGWCAVESFFGVSEREAYDLFSDRDFHDEDFEDNARSDKEVVLARLEKFIGQIEQPLYEKMVGAAAKVANTYVDRSSEHTASVSMIQLIAITTGEPLDRVANDLVAAKRELQ